MVAPSSPRRPAVRARVLVVDDEPAARATITAILDAEEEFDVRAVGDAPAAKAALATGPYDVVVTDFQLDGATGLGILRALPPGVTGILVTGHADHPEVQEARRNWRDFTVLLKPYHPGDLLRVVKSAAGTARVRQASLRLSQKRQP
jgi:DNA-binding NtrC family response regulator